MCCAIVALAMTLLASWRSVSDTLTGRLQSNILFEAIVGAVIVVIVAILGILPP